MGGSCLSCRSRLTGIRKPHQTLKMFWTYSLWHLLSFMLDYHQPCTVGELAVICSLGIQSPIITGSNTARVDPARTPWELSEPLCPPELFHLPLLFPQCPPPLSPLTFALFLFPILHFLGPFSPPFPPLFSPSSYVALLRRGEHCQTSVQISISLKQTQV